MSGPTWLLFEWAGSYISDDLLQRLAFAGTPDQVAS